MINTYILFLLFPSSSDMNSAICRYGDLGYQKKLRTAPISVFTPPLLVPATQSELRRSANEFWIEYLFFISLTPDFHSITAEPLHLLLACLTSHSTSVLS